jgi:hypothetical protein
VSALEQITQYQTLWAAVIPHIPPPSPEDVARWFGYQPSAVEHAIMRTARRFARDKVVPDFDPVQAYRFATATARSIADQMIAPQPAQKSQVSPKEKAA